MDYAQGYAIARPVPLADHLATRRPPAPIELRRAAAGD